MRALELYLGALWGGKFTVSFSPDATARASFDGRALVLPAGPSRDELALARAAHAGAHAAFSGPRFAIGGLKPLQRVLVSLFEDARVEAIAMQHFPGLRRVWQPFHAPAAPAPASSLDALLPRLARALFDRDYADPEDWIQKAQRAFFARETGGALLAAEIRQLGNVFGNELGQIRLPFDARSYVVEPAYRDDHAGLWDLPPAPARAVSNTGSVAKTAPPSPAPSTAATRVYPEWDHVIEQVRPAFCEVRDEPATGDQGAAAPAAIPPDAVLRRVRRNLRRPLWLEVSERRALDGAELDLAALVDATAESAALRSSSLRIYRRRKRIRARRSLLVLLDLSESSNLALDGGLPARALLALSAQLLCSLQLPALELAVDGFSSYGRRDVRYRRFKDFREPGAASIPRLAGLAAAGSTRLGAAVRHATSRLTSQACLRPLLLVLTDADPADVDVYDADYLVEDARAAVGAAERAGVVVFGGCLPGGAAPSRARIFGRNHARLERIGDLPDCLQAAWRARPKRAA